MVTGSQCRAARALLGKRQTELAQEAGVGVLVIKRFEAGSNPRAATANAIERALRAAGVIFVDDGEVSGAAGMGVRLAQRPGGDNGD
jgi:transcriptional regulator with XRE-family HTH domain